MITVTRECCIWQVNSIRPPWVTIRDQVSENSGPFQVKSSGLKSFGTKFGFWTLIPAFLEELALTIQDDRAVKLCLEKLHKHQQSVWYKPIRLRYEERKHAQLYVCFVPKKLCEQSWIYFYCMKSYRHRISNNERCKNEIVDKRKYFKNKLHTVITHKGCLITSISYGFHKEYHRKRKSVRISKI